MWWSEAQLHITLSQNSKGIGRSSPPLVPEALPQDTQLLPQLPEIGWKRPWRIPAQEAWDTAVSQKGVHVSEWGTSSPAWLCCRNACTQASAAAWVQVPDVCVSCKTPTQPRRQSASVGTLNAAYERKGRGIPCQFKTEMTLTVSVNDQRQLPTDWVQLRLLSHSSAVPLGDWICTESTFYFPQRNYAIKSCLLHWALSPYKTFQ